MNAIYGVRWSSGSSLVRLLTLLLLVVLLCGCDQGNTHQTTHFPTATTATETWASLEQRPLRLPALAPGTPCPRMRGEQIDPSWVGGFVIGKDPIYVNLGPASDQGILQFASAQEFGRRFNSATDWGGVKVLWWFHDPYTSAVLIRGHQIDGPNPLYFNGGYGQTAQPDGNWATARLLPELQLLAQPQQGSPWSTGGDYVRLQVPGCYAFQVDGQGYNEIFIVQAEIE